MGTRGAYGYIKKGVEKITYNHYDSYPSGLGVQIQNYIKERLYYLDKDFEKIKLVSVSGTPTKEQIQKALDAGTVDLNVGNQSPEDFYCLLREAQGNLENHTRVGMMTDEKEFMFDSLFCEWAYIINLDTRMLEIYRGFQTEKPEGRYAGKKDRWYWGVGLIKEIPLDIVHEFNFEELENENSD